MFEFLTRHRSGLQSTLHYSFEKAGLTLVNQPIPWNADAVIVEALLRLPPQQPRNREEFVLHVAGERKGVAAESLRPGDASDLCRLFFRIPVPAESTTVEVYWRSRSLGQLQLPVLDEESFLEQLQFDMPTLAVQLRGETVQCQTVVTTQCRHVLTSVIVSGPTSLVPLVDLGLRVQAVNDKGDLGPEAPLHFSSSQLRSRQALITALLPRPRRGGNWNFQWLVGETVRASQKLRAISKAAVQRSLRLSATRFVLFDADGGLRLTQAVPNQLEGVARVGPCFWVGSSEAGLASWCDVEVRARLIDSSPMPTVLHHQRVLLSDGPTPIVLGTLDVQFLKQVKHFELLCQNRLLGLLPLAPVPSANFTSEGGFEAPEEFSWSTAAEEQLHERLGRLLGGA